MLQTYAQADSWTDLPDVRVPDVYDITIKFTSLLPNNFNNFMFNYARKGKDIYSDESCLGHQDSAFTKFSNALGEDLKTVRNNINEKKQNEENNEMEKIADGLKKQNTVSLLDDGTKSKWDSMADTASSVFQTESSMFPIFGGSSMFPIN